MTKDRGTSFSWDEIKRDWLNQWPSASPTGRIRTAPLHRPLHHPPASQPLPAPVQLEPEDAAEPAVVAGQVRAYRAWKLKRDGLLSPLHVGVSLSPVTGRQVLYVAQCERVPGPFLDPDTDRPKHKAPTAACTCGFYAVYKGGLCGLVNKLNLSYGLMLVYGSVLMSGTVLMGETGVLRAEKMAVESLLIPSRLGVERYSQMAAQFAARLQDHYQVPVWPDVDMWLDRFPLLEDSDEYRRIDGEEFARFFDAVYGTRTWPLREMTLTSSFISDKDFFRLLYETRPEKNS